MFEYRTKVKTVFEIIYLRLLCYMHFFILFFTVSHLALFTGMGSPYLCSADRSLGTKLFFQCITKPVPQGFRIVGN